MTQTAIAECSGLSRLTVWRMSHGIIQDSKYSTALRIEALHEKVVARVTEDALTTDAANYISGYATSSFGCRVRRGREL